jgi:hypothetical protein
MAKILMANTKNYFLCSDEHFDYLNKFNWTEDNQHYAVRKTPTTDTIHSAKLLKASRIVMELVLGRPLTDEDGTVDHINREPLDNRKENLRLANYSQQNRNRHKSYNINCTSTYTGVDFHKQTQKWRSRIQLNEKSVCLGLFNDEESAARCYNAAVKLLHMPDGFYNLNRFARNKRKTIIEASELGEHGEFANDG